MAAIIETWLRTDLKQLLKVQELDGNMFTADIGANRIGVIVTDNGDPVTLTGTITGYLIRPDQATVPINNGQIQGNKAWIDLPAAAYAKNGPFSVVIKNGNTTICACAGYMRRSTTDNVVDPGTIIPSIEALIDAIEDAVDSIPADYSSLWTSLAPNFNPDKSGGYATDELCTYNGKVYVCTAPHTGAWNASHFAVTNIGAQLSGLKSAFALSDKLSVGLIDTTWEQGGIANSTGEAYDSPTNVRTGFVNLTSGEEIKLTDISFTNYVLWAHEYNSVSSYKQAVKITKLSYIPSTSVVRFRLTKAQSENISPDEVPFVFYQETGYVNERIDNNFSRLKSRFNGKKISIIGDSIDTFDEAGYKIDGYRMYYPSENVPDITSVDQTWWKQVIDNSGAKIEKNASYAGSCVTNVRAESGYPDFYDRVSVIGSPDVIFVTLGSNDQTYGAELGEYDFTTTYTNLSEDDFRPAYIKGIKALIALYPSAQIICIAEKMVGTYKDSIEYIAKKLNVEFIDASDYEGYSGVHPGSLGMQQIASYVLYPTDGGMWQAHYPADAKEVGNKISETRKEIRESEEKIEAENDNCGIYEIKHEYLYGKGYAYNVDGYIYSNDERTTTKLREIPKDGFYIYSDEKIEYRITFWEETESGIVPADDYAYSFNGESARDDFQKICAFYPYQTGVLYSITAKKTDSTEEIYKIHAVTGKINRNGGRIPNITPCVVLSDYANQVVDILQTYTSGGGMWSYTRNYCFVIPLEYVDKVIAEPPYSLIAEIHKINNDSMDETVYAREYAYIPESTSQYGSVTFGKSFIDISKYDFEGFAIIAVVPKMNPIIRNNIKTFSAGFMGWGLKYEDVLNSVFVKWKNGANVQYESGINPIANDNIQTLFDIKVPDMKASQNGGGFASWISSTKTPFPDMGECSLCWYGGGNAYNTPMMHINPKSFVTASKNRNSRMYIPDTGDGNTINLYGGVCSSTTSMILGLPIGDETYNYVNELIDHCDYREFDGLTSLKPGDVFAGGDFTTENGDYGHTVYITEVVTINGNVFSVNYVENYPPYMRKNMYVNFEKYTGYSTTGGLFTFHSSRGLNRYHDRIIARPHNSIIKSIRQAYGQYDFVDYPVTEIMCDRGTDSVYCIGERMVLTVTDSNITAFDVYVDGVSKGSVLLSSGTTSTDDDGNTVVVFAEGFVAESGYTVLKVGGTEKESFYVAKARTITYEGVDDETLTTRYSFDKSETGDTIVAAQCGYYDGYVTRYITIPFTETDGGAYVDVPNTKILYETLCWVSVVRILRRTAYGTYWHQVRSPLLETARFKQRAGVD